jgi:type I restriction enzyme S subunit
MVTGNLARHLNIQDYDEKDYSFLPAPIKFTSVTLLDVLNNKARLEASAFNLDAKAAINKVTNCKYGFVNLWSKNGLIDNAFYPGRFKRIYVSKGDGKPFFLPSQLTEINAKATKFISPKTYKTLKGVEIEPDQLLMTRSGTIGKCSISSKTNVGKLYSDDVIRVTFKSSCDLGYTYAFLNTKVGQLILQTNNYGAVVQHIEPDHLEEIVIPNAPDEIKEVIHSLIITSFDLRDQSNDILNRAEKILYEELGLPPLDSLKSRYFDNSYTLRNYNVALRNLNYRFDASYHIPLRESITEILFRNAKDVKQLRESDVSREIILPGRFKRTYVESEEHGIKFIGGKQINELNPISEKYLSRELHGTRLGKELLLKENSILITRSGTIGKVSIVPKHWESWAANEHLIRVFPASNDLAGYIYCWLNTEYGSELIKKHTYGSVVDEIDTNHVGDIPLPILKDAKKQELINDLVLQANKIRYSAFLKEKEAIDKMNEVIDS